MHLTPSFSFSPSPRSLSRPPSSLTCESRGEVYRGFWGGCDQSCRGYRVWVNETVVLSGTRHFICRSLALSPFLTSEPALHTFIPVWTHTLIYTHTHTHSYTHTQTHAHTCRCTNSDMEPLTHKMTHIFLQVYTQTVIFIVAERENGIKFCLICF